MADTLRDLVVSLSLDTTNFSKNMKSINTQIREAETYFKEAGAGIDKYEKTISGLSNKITTLERVERAQTQAVTENEKHVAQVNKKYEDAVVNLKNAKENLEKVTREFGENSNEAKKAAEQVNKCENALQNANIAQGQAVISLSKANTALKETRVELAKTRKELDGLKWTNIGDAMEKAGEKMIGAGKSMTKAGKTLTRTITAPLVALGTFSGKAYIEFEDAMAGVRKTVDATDEKFEELDDSIRQMALVTPTAASEIAFVMETAGQLGIGADAIEEFTKKMVDFGNVSNSLDAVTAAEQFARYANIRGDAITQDNEYFNSLTSTVFKLSNTMATTEADVTEMSMALAAAGTQVGMTDAQIIALAASLSSVGVSAQKGGTAFSKVLVKMEAAVAEGVGKNNKALADFAKVAGMTQEEFAQLWETDAGSAFMAFIDGVAKLDEEGVSAITTLQDLGLTEIRLRDTLLRTVNAQDLFVKAMASANDEWQTAEYMNEKVEERYASTANQIEILKNNATDLAMSIGEILLPYVNDFIGIARDFINQLKGMSKEELTAKLKMAGFAAAIGPAVMALGKLSQGIGFVAKGLGGMIGSVGKVHGGIKGLGAALVKSPALWMALAAAVAYAGYKFVDWVTGAKAAREALEDLDGTVREWEQNTTTAFEESGGLSALNMSKDAFGLDSFSANANEWLTNLIEVWTDGKKETDEIVQGMVDSWVEGSDKIREAKGITEEDKKALDDIDKEIESILKKRQNGYLTDKDKERLNELIGERDSIAIHHHLVEDVDSGFDDIVTNVDAALARGAKAEDVFVAGFAAANEGLGTYLDALNKSYDEQYATIQQITDEEERQAEMKKLNEWYDTERQKALDEYSRTLLDIDEAADPFGLDEEGNKKKYAEQVDRVKKLGELMHDAAGGDEGAKTELYGFLKDWDEADLIETKAAIDAYRKAYEQAGLEPPKFITDAEDAFTKIENLMADDANVSLFDADTQEILNKMFGGLDEETNEVFAHFNLDSLDVSFNTWAQNGTHSIEADVDTSGATPTLPGVTMTIEKITDEGIEEEDVDITSIDTLTGTVTYIEDGVTKTATFDELENMHAKVTFLDKGGKLKRSSLLDFALNAMRGKVKYVSIDKNTVLPEVELEATIKTPKLKEGEYTTDHEPGTGIKASWEFLNTPKSYGDIIEDIINEHLGTSLSMLDTSYIDGLKKIWKDPQSIFDTVGWSFGDGSNGMDVGGYSQLARYIADGLQLIKDDEMDDESRAEFDEIIGMIFDIIREDSPISEPFADALGNALKDFGYEGGVDEFASKMQELFGEDEFLKVTNQRTAKRINDLIFGKNGEGQFTEGAEGMVEGLEKDVDDAVDNADFESAGDDVAAGTGKGMADHDFTDDAGTMVDNALESSREAGDAHSPARKFIPVGEDIAAGVGVGMEEWDAESSASRLANNIRAALNNNVSGSTYAEIGIRITDGLVRGIQAGQSRVVAAIIDMTRKSVQAAKDELGIHSPSKVFKDEIGANLMKGIGEGVMQEAPAQGKVIANAARYLKDSAAGAMGGGHSSIAGNDVTTNNNVSSNITVNVSGSWSVRSDKDIRKLASQIARLTARVNYGYGMMNQMKKV